MKKHTVNIKTPEVTDVTDNLAGLATFAFSYIKNATDNVCDAIGKSVKQAKEDATATKDLRAMERLIYGEAELDYKKSILAKFEELKGRYND